jgi:hypothetical protein
MSTPQAIRSGIAHRSAHEDESELQNVDDRLKKEMLRLASINQDLLNSSGVDSKDTINLLEETEELASLRAENAELRAHVAELEQALTNDPTSWSERQKEYEVLLEEKSEVIRSLHLKIQEMQEDGVARGPAQANLGDAQRLQKELEEQRRQLEEDETVVMQQLREMEMAMSRDRAELARQRNEIQRLHADLNREIEIAARDPALRDRLIALQRLQGEVVGRKFSPQASATKPAAGSAPSAQKQSTNSSGLFRRIFGK